MNHLTQRRHRIRHTVLALGASCALFGFGASAYAAPAIWGARATLKVQPTASVQPNDTVRLSGARNEFVSFQVVVNGGPGGAKGVSASFSGLNGPSTISGYDLTLYREAYLHVSKPTSAGAKAGEYPDGLVPDVDEIQHEKRNAFPFDVAANESRAIWVDVHIPKGTPPGDYSGEVQVSADGFSGSVPVTLTVLPVTLPSTSSLPSAFLIFDGNVCHAHTGKNDCGSQQKHDELIQEYAQLALDHRFTLTNIYTPVPKGDDWSHFDSTWGPILDGHLATRLAGAKATSLQYSGPRDASRYSAFADHLKAKGWFDRAFDYTVDEPHNPDQWSQVASRSATVKQGAADLPTLVTTTIQNSDKNNVTDDIDTMVVEVNLMDGTGGEYDGDMRSTYDGWLSKAGKRLWMYQSCDVHGCAQGATGFGNAAAWPSYMIDANAAHNRAMQWDVFLENASGELYYETADKLPSAWSDQFDFNGNGDGTLFYPGTPAKIGGTTDVPVPSIRMKLLRMGMQDYEWLKLVSDAGDSQFAQQVARSVIPSASKVSSDGAAFDSARQQLEQRYLQLQPNGNGDGSDTSSLSSGQASAGGPGGCSTSGAAGLAPMALVGLALALAARRRRQRA